ncbi:heterokaryon incompatibility protein het-6-like protein [Colletotrichum kahawae]|uniref:Heterokaryon incompatibility protein het-6-like protein n=1 Tax=Colletotrichum kahawae TaxID=34407 RepID=A0AAD9YNX2_COLKA|nr:heterokaryon incompatibility protein het-6-like protein [Colletotrichum kahawae]
MSRWHSSSCADPRIVVEQQRPRCESCNSSPDIDGLVAAEASKPSPIPYLPPDEPPGEMHLWWPPCVPYVTAGPDGHPVPVQPPEELPRLHSSEGESPGETDRLHIYPQRLKEDEFRVMCLYAVEDVNDPIHISLDVYDDLRYHEYETVSYTWGGENGDIRLTQPVYIGPYWDILIQTHNCWEMLRHMRPWKGVRTIWVDATCINQVDMQERQGQVAKMGQTFEKASRLIIYLGPDLVPPTSTSAPHPRRHHLQELDNLAEKPQLPSASLGSSKQWTLSNVLEREYFRRLWIIQELVMSRNITLRIGDTEFIVDQSVSSDAAQASNLPWLTFITRKSIGDQSGNNLRAAVEFVDASRASDPRDKIFGVLGLIDSAEHPIAAAYLISFRHLVIGYYAYCLLTKKDIRIMLHASSLRSPEGMPSWAPPAHYDVSKSVHIIPGTGDLRLDWLYRPKDFEEAYKKHHCNVSGVGYEMVVFGESQCGDTRTCLKLACGWVHETQSSFETCWHSHAAIDSSTGAIHLTAMHLLSFGIFSTAEIEKKGKVYVHTLKAGTSTLFIYANESVINSADELDKLHLFVLCDNPDPDQAFGPDQHRRYPLDSISRLCILQQVNNDVKFRLLSASITACFHAPHTFTSPFYFHEDYNLIPVDIYRFGSNIFRAYDEGLSLPLPLARDDGPAGMSVREINGGFKGGNAWLNIQHLYMPFCRHIEHLRKLWTGLDGDPECRQYFPDVSMRSHIEYPSPRWAFPGVNNGFIFLKVFQSILDAERSGSSAGFFNIYLQAVREFSPKLFQWETRRSNTASSAAASAIKSILPPILVNLVIFSLGFDYWLTRKYGKSNTMVNDVIPTS